MVLFPFILKMVHSFLIRQKINNGFHITLYAKIIILLLNPDCTKYRKHNRRTIALFCLCDLNATSGAKMLSEPIWSYSLLSRLNFKKNKLYFLKVNGLSSRF